MKQIKCLLISLFFLTGFSLFAQLSTGMLKMEVSGIKLNGEDAPPEMASTLGNMNISIYSDGVVQKSEVNMMMMKTTTIMNTKEDSMQLYMDMMGKKYKISESRKSNTIKVDEKMESLKDNMELKEFEDDVKEILGYKCHRIEIKLKMPDSKSKNGDLQEMNMKMYVTNDLNFDPSYVTQMSKKLSIKGTPLEYNMTMGAGSFQMDITMLAKEYKKDIDPKDVLPPTGNFKTYTMEEFQAEMSKMKGRN